jgi:hypothetical protein
MRIARPGMADQQPGGVDRLLARLAAGKHRAQFEERQIHEAARLVARRRRQQPRQQVGAQMRHLAGDRVFQPHRLAAAAEGAAAPRR